MSSNQVTERGGKKSRSLFRQANKKSKFFRKSIRFTKKSTKNTVKKISRKFQEKSENEPEIMNLLGCDSLKGFTPNVKKLRDIRSRFDRIAKEVTHHGNIIQNVSSSHTHKGKSLLQKRQSICEAIEEETDCDRESRLNDSALSFRGNKMYKYQIPAQKFRNSRIVRRGIHPDYDSSLKTIQPISHFNESKERPKTGRNHAKPKLCAKRLGSARCSMDISTLPVDLTSPRIPLSESSELYTHRSLVKLEKYISRLNKRISHHLDIRGQARE